MKKILLLSTLIISATCSFAIDSNDSIRTYQKLFPAGVTDGRIGVQTFLYDEYPQGVPIVLLIRLYNLPPEKKQPTRNHAVNSTPLALGNTVKYYPKADVSSTQDNPPPPVDTKVYISNAWHQHITFTIYNAKGAPLETKVSSLRKDKVSDDLVLELPTSFERWIIEGGQTKDLQPGKYTLQVSLGPISQTNSFLIMENNRPQEAVLKVSNAWVSYLCENYREAIDLGRDAMAQGGRMVKDKNIHAISVMALSYEKIGDYKESLRLWEEFKEKYVDDFPKHRKPMYIHDLKIAELKKLIKKAEGQQGSTQK